MSLGLGSSTQRTSSDAAANSYGYTGSQSQDVSQSTQNAVSGGTSTSGQSIAFEDLFKQLYGNASGAAQSAAAGAPQLAQVAQQLFTGGSDMLKNLGGDVGAQYQQSRLSGDNPVLQEQIDALGVDTGKFFNEQLNPAITSRAIAGGTLGGGRQGVAQGIAADASATQFTRGATALRANDVNQRDQIAAQVAGQSLQAASTGLGALPTLLDVAERGNNAELGVYSSLAGILGGPTTLSQSQSDNFSRSTAQSAAEAFSKSFGEQTSESTSKSRGRANSWNFSAGVGPT